MFRDKKKDLTQELNSSPFNNFQQKVDSSFNNSVQYNSSNINNDGANYKQDTIKEKKVEKYLSKEEKAEILNKRLALIYRLIFILIVLLLIIYLIFLIIRLF